jgi:hypothetical protein
MKWLRKKISLKMEEAFEGAIVKAKDSGLDLSKTYIGEYALLGHNFMERSNA